MAKGRDKQVYFRVAKFAIHPTSAQERVLKKLSDNLKVVWNEALIERQKMYAEHLAPIYNDLSEAKKSGSESITKELLKELKQAYSNHGITLFDQINALTARRAHNRKFGTRPRSFQEETLDTLDGAYKSFLSLRRNGDLDSRAPQERRNGFFCEISGRATGWKIKDGAFHLLCKEVAHEILLQFPIPEKQLGEIALGVPKKFTLYRDESNLAKNGQYWISIACEVPMPDTKPFDSAQAVYVSLGASSIGEEVIPIGRPDWYWLKKIRNLEVRIRHPSVGTNIHALTPGSRVWHKRTRARAKMFSIMARQKTQIIRETVAHDLLEHTIGTKILGHGLHFVVTDLVIRSKKGKLADGCKPERGGDNGLNWAAQNTGSIAALVAWLEEKVKEHGGSVRRHRVASPFVPRDVGIGHENKIAMARALRDDFLRGTLA